MLFLQLLWSDYLAPYTQPNIAQTWTHEVNSFRLGSALLWFMEDADDALAWLRNTAL